MQRQPPPASDKDDDGSYGNAVKMKTARGTVVQGRYRFVEADDLVTSHDAQGNPNPDFPSEAQPRDRSRVASQTQIQDIKEHLDPDELKANYKASDGAPVTVKSEDGTKKLVVSGNARTNAIREAYNTNHPNAEIYRQSMIDDAGSFGLDPDEAQGMRKPVLVREVDGSKIDLGSFAQEANEDNKAAMSASEQGRADADRLTAQHMAMFAPNEDGDLTASSNRGFVRAFFQDVVGGGDRSELMDAKGNLSQAGVNRIRNAVFVKAYGTENGVLETLAESTDNNIRNVTGGMVQSAPAFAKMREAIASGDRYDLDVSNHVAEAAEQLAALRRDGQSAPDYLNQIGLFGEQMTPEGKAFLQLFDQYGRSPKKIAAILRAYTDAVDAAGSPKQGGLFGAKQAPNRQDVLAAAILAAERSFGNEQQQPEIASSGSLFDEGQPAASAGPSPEDAGSGVSPESGPAATAEKEPAAKGTAAPEPVGGEAPSQTGGTARHPDTTRSGSAPEREQPSAESEVTPPQVDHLSTGSKDLKLVRALQDYRKAHPDATAEEAGTHLYQSYPGYRDKNGRSGYSEAAYQEFAQQRMGESSPRDPSAGLAKMARAQAARAREKVASFERWKPAISSTDLAKPLARRDRLRLRVLQLRDAANVLDHLADLWEKHAVPDSLRNVATVEQVIQLLEQPKIAPPGGNAKPGTRERRAWENANSLLRDHKGGATQENWTALRTEIAEMAEDLRDRKAAPEPPEEAGSKEGPGTETPSSSSTGSFKKGDRVVTVEQGNRHGTVRKVTESQGRTLYWVKHDEGPAGLHAIEDLQPEAAAEPKPPASEVATAFGGPVKVLGLADDFEPYKTDAANAVREPNPEMFLVEYPDGKKAVVLGSSILVDGKPLTPKIPQEGRKGGVEETHAKLLQEHGLAMPERGLSPEEEKFVRELLARLEHGDSIDNRELARMADQAFGGGRLQGKWDIKHVYDLVEAAVARWEIDFGDWTKKPAHELKVAQHLLDRLPRQADRTKKQEDFQQFSTPPTLALVAAAAAGLRSDDVVLEPSAGTGMLAAWARSAGVAEVLTNEIDPGRRQILESEGFAPTDLDAEQIHNLTDLHPSVVLMNPPFSAAGNRGIAKDQTVGQRHVEQALLTLRPGGRLVAILPGGRDGFEGEGASMRSTAWSEWWDRIVKTYHVRANIGIPGKAYGKFGTDFPTRLVVIDNDGPTPGSNLLQQLQSVESKQADSLQEALDVLAPIAADRPAVSADPGSPRPGVRGTRGPAEQTGGKPRAGGREPSSRPARPGDREEPDAKAAVPATPPEKRPAPGNGERPGDRERGAPGTESPKPKRVAHPVLPVEPGVNLEALQSHDVGEGTFTTYQPQKLRGGAQHPAAIVQSTPLAAVDAPDIAYTPSLDPQIFTSGKLSNVQAEAVYYAGQRHSRQLSTGERAGIFIGDGTGVGKGREIAGIIADNWAAGRRRAVWFSVSSDLVESAKRDLEDLGVNIPIHVINEWKGTDAIDLPEGIVFSTYASLIGESKGKDSDENAPPSKRLDQLARWAGEDGVIVFDEAHKAKNAWDSGTGEPTQTGVAVLKIQETLPQARVVYASATGATDPVNMAYMTRLGMWGKGTAFENFGVFLGEVDGGGVGAMEMVARDMKARGAYLARTISYEGVAYREAFHDLTPKQRAMYDVAARAWLQVIRGVEAGIAATHTNGRARAFAMSRFWSAHQRFFKQLITAIKVPTCIAEVQKALDAGKSAIISVMSTGEAQQERLIQRTKEQGGELEDIDFSPREMLDELIVRIYPIHANEEVKDPKSGKTSWRPVKDKDGNPVIDRQALAAREALRDSLTDIDLPDNPIDQIIQHFGADHVAELTGRKRRIGVNEATGKKEVQKRKAEGVAQKRTNLAETEKFQSGKKRIAIISDAASTGISLHADRRAENQQQRVHIALELKWSADKQLQDFGRSHRSNQVQAPEYVLISTDIGGDKRFSSTIARRLASLGALTQGSREAASGGEIAKYNFESGYGRAAVTRTLRALYGTENGQQTLLDMGLVKRNENGQLSPLKDQDLQDVPRFLNRVLSLDLPRQNQIFGDFLQAFAAAIDLAKRQGTFETGVSDVKAEAIRVTSSRVVHTDPVDGSETKYYGIELDEKTEPLSWGDAIQRLKLRQDLEHDWQGPPMGWYYNKRSGHVSLILGSGTITDPRSGEVTRKYAAYSVRGNSTSLDEHEIDKYEQIDAKAARSWWDKAYGEVPRLHTRQMHIIGGAILGVWRQLQAAGARGMTVRRVTSDAGERVVGLEIPPSKVAEVLKALGVGRDLVKPEDVFHGVLDDGEEIQLAADLKLRRTKVHGETAIELVGVGSGQFAEMDGLGLIRNRIDSKVRFFVPSDEKTGVPIVEKLLAQYPVIRSNTSGLATGRRKGAAQDVAGSPAYRPEAPLPHQAMESRANALMEPGEAPILLVNRQAFALMAHHVNLPTGDGMGSPIWGVTLTAGQAAALRQNLNRLVFDRHYVQSRERVKAILTEIDRITSDSTGKKGQRPLPIANPQPGLSEEMIAEIVAEERAHYRQLGINGTFEILPTAEFLADADAQTALDHLRTVQGYDSPDHLMGIEIGARLMWGGGLGLDAAGTARLAHLYTRLLRAHNGNRANAVIHEVRTRYQLPALGAETAGAIGVRENEIRRGPSDSGNPAHRGFAFARGPLASAAETVYDTRDDIRKVANPTALGTEAKTAGLSLRNHAAEMAQTFARAEEALDEAHKLFATRSWADNLDFINAVESGQQQADANLQTIADTMRNLLDAHRLAVQGLGKNKLTQFYVNYFPHLWQRPQQAASVFAQIFGRRPLEGTKAFLKQRKLQTFQDGVDAGLQPVSENPVDLVLLKLREMERYILAHRFLNEMRTIGLARYVPAIGPKSTPPEGWVKAPDAIGTVWRPPVVPVKEALDKEMIDGLTDIAQKLGITQHRGTGRTRAHEWGNTSGNAVFTKFGGPESVIVHEIGHVLDSRYHLADQLRGLDPEMRALADLRLTGGDPAWYEKYVHQEGEQAANMVAAYVHNRARMQRVAPRVFQWFDDFVQRTPELAGLRKLEYGMQLAERESGLNVGGFIQVGHYYMPSGAAQIVSNYLSPGLQYKSWYKVLRGTSNMMLQFALGFSAFHAGFTTMDAAISKLAIALKHLASGHPVEAAKHIAMVPASPVLNVMKGARLRAAYLDRACNDPELLKYVQALVEGGGRVKMDEAYRTNMRQRFLDAVRNREVVSAVGAALPALAETTVYPILEWLVPRQKLGVFADMVDYELERIGPNASLAERRAAFARAWDSVDNRMGQLVYDNLFWNRTLKDLSMITVQSVGWNLGTFREIGGAGIDAGRFVRNGGRFVGGGGRGGSGSGGSGRLSITNAGGPPPAATTPPPEFTHRMAYVASLVLLTGAIGAVTTYLATGHGPKDKRDYFFPQVGGRRWALPSYMTDVFHWSEDPAAAARGKIHPWLRTLAEMMVNADWQNREIYDKNDPCYTIGLDLLKHLGGAFEPYAWRNQTQLGDEGALAGERIAPFVGARQAPAYLSKTPAQRLLGEYIGDAMPKSAQSKEEWERKQARRDLENAVRRKDPDAKRLALEALRSGKLTVKDERLALSNVGKDPDVGRLTYLAKENLEHAFEVYRAASADERKQFKPVMQRAFVSAVKNESPLQAQALVRRFRPEIESLR